MSIGQIIIVILIFYTADTIKRRIDMLDDKLDNLLIKNDIVPKEKVSKEVKEEAFKIRDKEGTAAAIKYLMENSPLSVKEAKDFIDKE